MSKAGLELPTLLSVSKAITTGLLSLSSSEVIVSETYVEIASPSSAASTVCRGSRLGTCQYRGECPGDGVVGGLVQAHKAHILLVFKALNPELLSPGD